MAACFEETSVQTLLDKIAKDEGFENPKFNIASATSPGENFIGQVLRVQIEEKGKSKCLSLIFKMSSPSKARKEMVSSDILFRTESEIYETILPTLNNFLKKKGVSNSPIFPGTARCYATLLNNGSDGTDVVVLEDKTVDGYSQGGMRTTLDAGLPRLALQKVALLHSSYLALREQEPETADRLIYNISNKKLWEEDDDPLVMDFKRAFINGLEFLGEPYTKGNPIYEKLRKMGEHLNGEFKKVNIMPVDVACINHGDFWANNVLFKEGQNGIPTDACMIDYQASLVRSPVGDVTTFPFMCTSKECRDQHYDEFIRLYYDEVAKTLLACGCDPAKIFPWAKYLEHLQLYGRVGVMLAIGCLPVMMADWAEVQDDIHAEDAKGIFAETAKIRNKETLKRLTQRLNGVVQDAANLGYI